MKVKHYMTKDVVTVTPDVKVTDAVDLMESNDFHRLPVVSDGKFVGLITEDIIATNSPSQVSSLSIYEMNYIFDKMVVKDLMRKDVTTINEEMLLEEAALLMAEHDITVLPVLNDQNEVIGIVTHKDIFKALIELTGYSDEGARILIVKEQDRLGVIAEISKALADNEINLTHIFVNRPDNTIEITIQTTGPNAKNARNVVEALGYEVYDIV